MFKKCYFWFLFFMIGSLINQMPVSAQFLYQSRDEGNLVYKKYKNRQKASLSKGLSKADRGVGVLDRGELSNVIGNFGVLSNFHLFEPALHWPSWADDTHQYCFGLELLVGLKGDVITSIHDPATVAENFDWEALDGSFGNLFSGNVNVSDGTPVLSSSDIPASWPQNPQGKPFWPGMFRLNPNTGKEVSGEFISERDVYAQFSDQTNFKGPYGIKVIQNSYSFSRSYAQDFLIFDFLIINTSNNTLDSVWVGYMADFKVDFDAHDHIRLIALDKRKPADKDLIYLYDSDPSEGIWDITGYIGFLSLFTPRNKGITDFHYFDNIYEPSTNEQLWEIMSSDISGKNITIDNYFHGNNRRIDDTSLSDDMDPTGNNLGTDFVFLLSSGPITLTPNDTVHSAFSVVLGATEADMLANAEMVKNMSKKNYLGPSAPRSPQVQAVPGDKKVTLTWDGRLTEYSRDILSGKMDFEGYKIYRSDDYGQSWGNPITDEHGTQIGFVPLAQFDLDNKISGRDPNSNFYLGNDSGLKYTLIDSTVSNGKEYWYSVTAYDAGDQTTGVAALESPRGMTADEPNLIRVIPSAPATGFIQPAIENGDSIPPLGGNCDSRLSIQILDPQRLTGHRYQVTFNDLGFIIIPNANGNPDTTFSTTFNLIDLSTGDSLLINHPLLNDTGDNVPLTDGFRVLAQDVEPGVKLMDWTLVHGETCNFDWHREVRGNENGAPWINGWDDFRITVDLTGPGIPVMFDDQFGEMWGPENIPIGKVECITDPNNPLDVSFNTTVIDYAYHGWSLPEPDTWFGFFGPLGWDLEPGGKAFNPTFEKWPDALSFKRYYTNENGDTLRVNGVDIRTQNRPAQIPPSDGDQFTIITRKTFRSNVYFEFDTPVPAFETKQMELDQIKVVPNPYIVRSGFERSQFEGNIQFTNLPPNCEIIIYSTSGDHITTLIHDNPTNYEFWNLQNKSGVNIAYGLYVYVVKTPDNHDVTGRFVIIR